MNKLADQNLCIFMAAQAKSCSENETALRAEFLPILPDVGEPFSMGESIRWSVIQASLFDGDPKNYRSAWVFIVSPTLEEPVNRAEFDSYFEGDEFSNQSLEVFLDEATLEIVDVNINFLDQPMPQGRRLIGGVQIGDTSRFRAVELEWVVTRSEILEALTENDFNRVMLTYCERSPLPAVA